MPLLTRLFFTTPERLASVSVLPCVSCPGHEQYGVIHDALYSLTRRTSTAADALPAFEATSSIPLVEVAIENFRISYRRLRVEVVMGLALVAVT